MKRGSPLPLRVNTNYKPMSLWLLLPRNSNHANALYKDHVAEEFLSVNLDSKSHLKHCIPDPEARSRIGSLTSVQMTFDT